MAELNVLSEVRSFEIGWGWFGVGVNGFDMGGDELRENPNSIVTIICKENHQDSDDCKDDIQGDVGVN